MHSFLKKLVARFLQWPFDVNDGDVAVCLSHDMKSVYKQIIICMYIGYIFFYQFHDFSALPEDYLENMLNRQEYVRMSLINEVIQSIPVQDVVPSMSFIVELNSPAPYSSLVFNC